MSKKSSHILTVLFFISSVLVLYSEKSVTTVMIYILICLITSAFLNFNLLKSLSFGPNGFSFEKLDQKIEKLESIQDEIVSIYSNFLSLIATDRVPAFSGGMTAENYDKIYKSILSVTKNIKQNTKIENDVKTIGKKAIQKYLIDVHSNYNDKFFNDTMNNVRQEVHEDNFKKALCSLDEVKNLNDFNSENNSQKLKRTIEILKSMHSMYETTQKG